MVVVWLCWAVLIRRKMWSVAVGTASSLITACTYCPVVSHHQLATVLASSCTRASGCVAVALTSRVVDSYRRVFLDLLCPFTRSKYPEWPYSLSKGYYLGDRAKPIRPVARLFAVSWLYSCLRVNLLCNVFFTDWYCCVSTYPESYKSRFYALHCVADPFLWELISNCFQRL